MHSLSFSQSCGSGVQSAVEWSEICMFFFQAEDGIRDLTVTGVQTCALPISPREGGPRHPRRLAAGNPELWLEVGPVDDEREVDVHASRSLHTSATGSCVERADRPDVRPVEQVVLDPNDSVVGLVCPAGLRVERSVEHTSELQSQSNLVCRLLLEK